MNTRLIRGVVVASALALPFALGVLPRVMAQTGGRVDASLYSALRWRLIGP